MEPTTSAPTDEMRHRLTLALGHYVSKLLKINYEKLRTAVNETNEEWDKGVDVSSRSDQEQADSIEQRIWGFQDDYLNGNGYDDGELTDLVSNIDDLLEPDIARCILPAVIDEPESPERFELDMRRIERELQAQAMSRPILRESYVHTMIDDRGSRNPGSGPGSGYYVQEELQPGAQYFTPPNNGDDLFDSSFAMPNEYRILMSLCSEIRPPGLYAEVQNQDEIAITSCPDVPPLHELKERLFFEHDGWTTYAGFITGSNGFKERMHAGWVLCERAAAGDRPERRRAWRIVYAVLLGGSDIFDSVEEFLDYYSDFQPYGAE